MKAASIRFMVLVVGIAEVGTGLRDLGLSQHHIFGLFFGSIIGGASALLRLWLFGKCDMKWPIAAAVGLTLITTFLRDMGLPLPFTTMDYQEGAFCGLIAGATAIWLNWPSPEIGASTSNSKR
ncbi:hypothetical protein [Bradyrhizobium sp. 18]|uniref:hypothetical protein n=1 Tax=Bradyrhizobium sp. 18 TaxID=2782657 RepID=UPI001FF8B6D3|nr:hypothetical protein [Bradyrhizobium sp. 18]MCK1505687.1 hypothetical protein [Bradyrhizobium sp. 18]